MRPPLNGVAAFGGYVYHTPGCFCIWAASEGVQNYCDYYGLVPNPLYEGEPGYGVVNNYDYVCVTPEEEAQVLDYVYGEWGEDCKKGTPDDDINDVGQDECAEGFMWDDTVCECVGYNPECQSVSYQFCIQLTYSPLTCDCISYDTYELMQSLNPDGEDCIPGTFDDPQNPEPC